MPESLRRGDEERLAAQAKPGVPKPMPPCSRVELKLNLQEHGGVGADMIFAGQLMNRSEMVPMNEILMFSR